MSELTFNEELHQYRLDGKVIPSVTQILRPLMDFSMVRADVLNAASAFGRAVHRACELHDWETLDRAALAPELEPYLQAWIAFSKDYEVKWSVIEKPFHHLLHEYAGTPDRFGLVRGKHAVVDIKSGLLMPAAGPQMAAYKNIIPGCPPICQRIGVRLKADGTYDAKEYTDRDDWSLFLSLMTLRRWTARHNITPNFQKE